MTSKFSPSLKRLKTLAREIPDEPLVRGLLRLIEIAGGLRARPEKASDEDPAPTFPMSDGLLP
jgi:hypothetical protein